MHRYYARLETSRRQVAESAAAALLPNRFSTFSRLTYQGLPLRHDVETDVVLPIHYPRPVWLVTGSNIENAPTE